MSEINYQALREKAEKATCGVWSLEYGEGRFDGDDALIHREAAGYIPICRIEGAHPESGFDEDFQMEQQANAEFIAAASPAAVLALLDEREAAKKRIAELEKGHQEAAKQINSWRRLAKQNIAERGKDISELEAARQRIAELERTEIREDGNQFLVVRHPGKLPVIKHCVGELEDFLRQLIERDSLVTIDIITHRYYGVGGQWVQDADEYLQMMQGDGIGVKQQEDSVDSDVGRNQPGMVVAVHIDAGDFVKVKGQVFEVEETDFDDHDVTLWFVGGNALKCAAGCPVEVVSAPVAAGIKVKGE
ncbi:ead/Ea22-like family protein [Salmonella enterica subsp. enterica]|nr:ead/Ea22-like family protein [Salmonella enterica subsp. enterica serovar Panama]